MIFHDYKPNILGILPLWKAPHLEPQVVAAPKVEVRDIALWIERAPKKGFEATKNVISLGVNHENCRFNGVEQMNLEI